MTADPKVGRVQFGDFERVVPISRDCSADRGTPVDRYYIDGFLASHESDIRGRVLEIGGDTYTKRLGGDHVTHASSAFTRERPPAALVKARSPRRCRFSRVASSPCSCDPCARAAAGPSSW